MTVTIRERLATLETQVKGMNRILWFLVSTTLAQVGLQIYP